MTLSEKRAIEADPPQGLMTVDELRQLCRDNGY
jgi:hypothetical protein